MTYAFRGWQVFPTWWPLGAGCACGRQAECPSVGKHPLARLAPKGLLDATADPAIINGWWRQYPQANIAIRTGPESGFWVLDVDAYKGGAYALEDLESTYGKLPTSLRARTGSGGASTHILFRYPTDVRVASHPIPGVSGLDVKGAGGYIIAEPSLHKSGGRYTWLDGGPEECSIEDAPEWLLAKVASPAATAPKAPLPTGMELDDESAEEVCSRFFDRAAKKITDGEARHDTAVWFFVQCKDNAVPFEYAARWIDPLHTVAREMGGREVSTAELQSVLSWAYSKDRRDPLPSVARRLRDATAEEPPDIPWEAPESAYDDDSQVQEATNEPDPGSPPQPRNEGRKGAGSGSGQASKSILRPALDFLPEGSTPKLATGLPPIDRITGGGLRPGKLVVQVGAPGSGKTVTAIQTSVNMARAGHRVAILPADESPEPAAVRIAQQLGFPRAKLEAGDPETVAAARAAATGLDITILDPSDEGACFERLRKECEATNDGRQLVVVLDSAQTVPGLSRDAKTKDNGARERVMDFVGKAYALARETGAIVLLTSQANRGFYRSKKKDDNSDPMAAGSETSALEYRADLVLVFEEAKTGDDVKESIVHFPKNRLGCMQGGSFRLRLDPASCTYSEVVAAEDEIDPRLRQAVSEMKHKILDALRKNPGISERQLYGFVRGSRPTFNIAIDELSDSMEIIGEPGPRNAVLWKVASIQKQGKPR